ncbi:unnamed protein product [Effrenium voratum]|uniref:Uncharacterized protein n=1 Tax=Effrenium voratum TaxID=2562239 RepID=A0AA36HLA4_9DINO|nr:unnamed protein product [Effrenium voratum]CAJ1451813.1 unnamed protein product [Effrenium voratum]|mmetsp:Transcript_97439/g.231869  ORF Transcript_97439/g.231869 Transcript_97439/m.231869 type:complete len:294 (-) Transcript_97439:114-995(-)
MGIRTIEIADSDCETETTTTSSPEITPEKRSAKRRRLRLETPAKRSRWTSASLAETPSRRDGIPEDQERRFRLALCDSTASLLKLLVSGSQLQRAQVYACHAVQLYFMSNSFRSCDFEATALAAASKALKDSGMALPEEELLAVLQKEQVVTEALGPSPLQRLRQETRKLELLVSCDRRSRYVDLISLAEDATDKLLLRLSHKQAITSAMVLQLREAARGFAVGAMQGLAPLMFRPETLGAVASALGARQVLKAEVLPDEIRTLILEDQKAATEEFALATREVLKALELKCRP